MPLDARPGVFRLSSGFFSSIFAADLKYRWRTENPTVVSGPRPFRGSRKRSRPLFLFYIKVSRLVSYFVRHLPCQKGTLSFLLAIKKQSKRTKIKTSVLVVAPKEPGVSNVFTKVISVFIEFFL